MTSEKPLAGRALAALAALLLAGCLETKTGSNGTGGTVPQAAPALLAGTLVGVEPFAIGTSSLDTAAAAIRRDEVANAGSAGLRLGMNAQAEGTVTGALGSAPVTVRAADTQSAARGFVRGVDAAGQRFNVATLTFVVDANTLYDGVAGIAALAPGDYVEVSGLTLADLRSTLATRVTRTPAPADGRTSIAARIDFAAAGGPTIAGISVPGLANLSFLPGAGNRVRVSGVLDAQATTIASEQVVVLTDLAPAAATRVEIEGIALDASNAGAFRMRTPERDYAVTLAAGTAPAAVTAGARVRVTGTAASTTSISSEAVAVVAPGQIVYRVTGVVSDFASLASLRVRGEPADLTTAVIRGGNASEIANGRRLSIVGTAGPGALRVSEATLVP